MAPQTFVLKQIPGARQANRVRCVTFGAGFDKVETEYRYVDIG